MSRTLSPRLTDAFKAEMVKRWLLRPDQVASRSDVRRLLVDRLHLDPMSLGVGSSVFLLDASFGAEVVAVDVSEVGVKLALSP